MALVFDFKQIAYTKLSHFLHITPKLSSFKIVVTNHFTQFISYEIWFFEKPLLCHICWWDILLHDANLALVFDFKQIAFTKLCLFLHITPKLSCFKIVVTNPLTPCILYEILLLEKPLLCHICWWDILLHDANLALVFDFKQIAYTKLSHFLHIKSKLSCFKIVVTNHFTPCNLYEILLFEKPLYVTFVSEMICYMTQNWHLFLISNRLHSQSLAISYT